MRPEKTMLGDFQNLKRIVVKTGSALVVGPDGNVDRDWMDALFTDVAALRTGREFILVSSGAIAVGRALIKVPRTQNLEVKQACAAVGQPRLMAHFGEIAGRHDVVLAQALLTLEDTETRRRWLNARATLDQLLGWGVIPVINENDTVATDEIRYGDNDRLAARVAQMTGADLLVLLSDIDGLYTADPRKDAHAEHIAEVGELTPDIMALGGAPNEQSGIGSGGMATKLAAARIAQSAGCSTLITLGRRPRPLRDAFDGARGTLIRATASSESARRQWLAGHLTPEGQLVIDDGARRALLDGKSLLSVGIRSVSGRFDRGAAVAIVAGAGRQLGRGLVAYSSEEIARICGKRSEDIAETLGYARRPAVIHRNDMVLDPH